MTPGELVRLDSTDPTPIYAQIERGIRAAVGVGRLGKGDQLPTVRQLAVALKVNANTVARVYASLEKDGVVDTQRGVGTFVADAPSAPIDQRGRHQALRDFAARVLEEAAARGFSREELVAQLEAQLKEANRV